MLMIGDGVLGMVYPRDHCLVWHGGPSWWRSTIDWFAAHPSATRSFAAAEIAAGLWLARQQEQGRRVASPPRSCPDALLAADSEPRAATTAASGPSSAPEDDGLGGIDAPSV
jgi:hypothetical protein